MKRFVPLQAGTSPTPNPYEVTTFVGGKTSMAPDWPVAVCARQGRRCESPPLKRPPSSTPQNSTIAKVMTIEDELRRLQQLATEHRFQRPVRRRCLADDMLTMCIQMQRSPRELQMNAAGRENYLYTQENLERRVHEGRTRQILTKREKLAMAAAEDAELPCDQHDRPPIPKPKRRPVDVIKLKSPLQIGYDGMEKRPKEGDDAAAEDGGGEEESMEAEVSVKPQFASPACSLQAFFEPTQKMLALKRQKSGLFHNETDAPPLPPGVRHLSAEDRSYQLDYNAYNPRQLQEQFDAQQLKHVPLIEGNNPEDLWTWNIGLQRENSEMDRAVQAAVTPPFDCMKPELLWFEIPSDLHKTFVGQFVYGELCVRNETSSKKFYYNQPAEIACIYVAYVETFRTPPDYWTNDTLNDIITAGMKLHKRSVDLYYKSPDTDFDIIPQMTDRQAIVGLKVHYKGKLCDEPNIYKALSLFYAENDVGVLATNNLYLLIWKRCSTTFYIYDPNGRDLEGFRDISYAPSGGRSSLIVTQHVEHVLHLVLHFSNVKMDDEYTLYEIYPIDMGKITQPLQLSRAATKLTRRRWLVVNEEYALIPSSVGGLPQPTSRPEKPKFDVPLFTMGMPPKPAARPNAASGGDKNASMVASLLAILYADIEAAHEWRPEVLDDLLQYGKKEYARLVKRLKLKKTQYIHIADMPEQLQMGVYRAKLTKRAFLYTGQVVAENECPKYRETALVRAIEKLLGEKSQWQAGLLQMDGATVLALFRDRERFYCFDPFRRSRVGLPLALEEVLVKAPACLQIHVSLESLCRMVYRLVVALPVGDKFLLHGLNVLSIKPVFALRYHKNRYPRLLLTMPDYMMGGKPTEATPAALTGGGGDGVLHGAGGIVGPDGVVVGARPAKKSAPKKVKPERRFSMPRLQSAEKLPSYTEAEMVVELIEEIICSVLRILAEPMPSRLAPYARQAAKVLLHTDREYLQLLRHQVQHGADGPDNAQQAEYEAVCPAVAEPRPLTLEEELLVPSNYEMLPDNAWVIFGRSLLKSSADATCADLVPGEEEEKRLGLLAALVSAALTVKYKVSTWNSQLVEYAITAVASFEQPHLSTYGAVLQQLLARQVPRIKIGNNTYETQVPRITHSGATEADGGGRPLRETLLQLLINFSRLLVVCQRFGCLIVRRYNFLYMFVGYACNAIGYRRFGPGRACMLRFVELDALLRRIELGCNAAGCAVSHYAVCALEVRDVPDERYLKWPDYDAAVAQREAHSWRRKQRELRKGKLDFLDGELQRETARIEGFEEEKRRRLAERQARRSGKRVAPKGSAATLRPGAEGGGGGASGEEEDGAGEEQTTTAAGEEEAASEEQQGSLGADSLRSLADLQHTPGRQLPPDLEPYFRPRPIVHGYRLRAGECIYKIQGTWALLDRESAPVQAIKPCFFAAVVALLFVVVRPLRDWTEQRVDQVLDTAQAIAARTTRFAMTKERRIRHILADDYEFDVITRAFVPIGINTPDVVRRITKALKMRRYLLLQLANCTFALYHDEFYHLFDAYGSMNTIDHGGDQAATEGGGEKEGDGGAAPGGNRRPGWCTKGTPKYGERNTASWVLFVDVASLLAHIDRRCLHADWQQIGEYQLHVVDILAHRRIAERTRLLRLMTDQLAGPTSCRTPLAGVADPPGAEICARHESLAWVPLDPHCLPVWSRLQRRNTDGRYRNLPLTRLRHYDVEIAGRLWSMWGGLHPSAAVFDPAVRGKQYLACAVIACCAALAYPLLEWSPQLLDSIVISGDRYHRESLKRIARPDYEFSLEDLDVRCALGVLRFLVHVEPVAYGVLYGQPSTSRMNLAEAFMYFFSRHSFGIVQCAARKRIFAIGRTPGHDGGYFLFDCQSRDAPLFPRGQGAAYLLRTRHLQVLLYAAVVALSVPHYNVTFTVHKVDVARDEAVQQGGAEEAGAGEGREDE